MKKLLSSLPSFDHQHHRNVGNHKKRTQSLAELAFLDVFDWQPFDDTGDDDGCDVDFDDTGDDGGCDDDVADTGGDDGGQIVDVDQHQVNGGRGTHSYGGNNEDDT